MPIRLLIIAGFIFFSADFATAQPQKNSIYIRTNLLSLIEPYRNGGPTFGVEYFLTDHFSLGTDIGVILYNGLWAGNYLLGTPHGYKIKPELRYYLYRKNNEKRARVFFSAEGLLLKTTISNYNSLPIFDNTGNVMYYYSGGYKEVKSVKGIVTKGGVQIPRFIFKKMLIEFYVGVGVRDKRFSYINLPVGASTPSRTNGKEWFNIDVDGTYPSISAGFKMVYKIK